MANKERGETSFTVGETTYTLKLTTDAMAQLEDACSTDEKPLAFPDILQRVLKGSVKYMRLYIWASMQEHHAGITVKQVGQLIDDLGGVTGLWGVLQQVSETAKPDPEDVRPQTAQATTRRRGTGGRSTSKPALSA